MLVFDCVGRGRAIVLLHGAFSDRRIWGYQVATLSSSNCVIAVDLPGFGGSAWDRRDPWHECAVAGVIETIRASDAGAAPVIVGWGESGAVAGDVARSFDGSRLVLIGASVDARRHDDRSERQVLSDHARFARTWVRAATSLTTSMETEDWMFAMAVGSAVDAQLAAMAETVDVASLPYDTVAITGEFDRLVEEPARLRSADEIALACGHTPQIELAQPLGSVLAELARKV